MIEYGPGGERLMGICDIKGLGGQADELVRHNGNARKATRSRRKHWALPFGPIGLVD